MAVVTFSLPADVFARDLFGALHSNAGILETAFSVRISCAEREKNSECDAVCVSGEEENAKKAVVALEILAKLAQNGGTVDLSDAEYAVSVARDADAESVKDESFDVICQSARGRAVKPKTAAQRKYIDMIRDNSVVLCKGPAGTGKTFLAVCAAVEALRKKEIERIVLTRPAIEAGERLGFLPGDLQSKIDPYLRPLYDALSELLGMENFQKYLERGTIELAPLAYMRGRTLNDSFIILDEGQNTTTEQMKMFLTRIGYRSKTVITGDLSQTDLPFGKKSGLAVACEILDGIDGIGIFSFADRDVVRHPLVRKIISAYDIYEKNQSDRQNDGEGKKN